MILVRYLSAILVESLSGVPSGLVALFELRDLTIWFISFLEAGGKSKLRESGMIFVRINDGFYSSSILTLGIGLPIEEGCFPKMVSTIFI